MRYVPPFAVLSNWIDRYNIAGTTRLAPPYDDVLDVLKGYLQAIPVDDDWYKAEYPAIAEFLTRLTTETAALHYQKHGYFEGRRPFAPGWRGLSDPVPFAQLKTRLRIIPTRGRLRVDIEREDMLSIIKAILAAVPVDETWYRDQYPDAVKAINDGPLSSISHHYANYGYFENRFPFDVTVDESWYTSRYEHVRIGLERGVARNPQDHFMRLGYKEGCRPIPP